MEAVVTINTPSTRLSATVCFIAPGISTLTYLLTYYCGSHLLHRTIDLTGAIGPLTLTLTLTPNRNPSPLVC